VGQHVTTIVVDSDALIALFHPGDVHAERAEQILQALLAMNPHLLYPASVLLETITLLQRRLKQPAIAQQLSQLIAQHALTITPVTQETIYQAVTFFKPTQRSTHHTLFDAVVAATAKTQQADAIFSFDGWYKSLGFKLAGDLVKVGK
jgi:predicted nucleic acid-binding protein